MQCSVLQSVLKAQRLHWRTGAGLARGGDLKSFNAVELSALQCIAVQCNIVQCNSIVQGRGKYSLLNQEYSISSL